MNCNTININWRLLLVLLLFNSQLNNRRIGLISWLNFYSEAVFPFQNNVNPQLKVLFCEVRQDLVVPQDCRQ